MDNTYRLAMNGMHCKYESTDERSSGTSPTKQSIKNTQWEACDDDVKHKIGGLETLGLQSST